jgi:Raf kinase inhibitor-like YbhB/YbcL family protein
MEDPDAPGGTFIHWIVYAIPPTIRHLPAGIPPQELLPNGIKQGLNTAKKLGYFGPCPPVGSSPHRYQLTLYALKHPLPEDLQRLPAAILRERIRQAAFEQTSLQGRYDRPAKKAG